MAMPWIVLGLVLVIPTVRWAGEHRRLRAIRRAGPSWPGASPELATAPPTTPRL